jgi:hypothetical protein
MSSEASSVAAVSFAVPSVVPGVHPILDLLEEVKAPVELSDGLSVETEVDTAPAESQDSDTAVGLESSSDFDLTEASGLVPTVSVTHSKEQIEPIATPPALEGTNDGTPSSEQ